MRLLCFGLGGNNQINDLQNFEWFAMICVVLAVSLSHKSWAFLTDLSKSSQSKQNIPNQKLRLCFPRYIFFLYLLFKMSTKIQISQCLLHFIIIIYWSITLTVYLLLYFIKIQNNIMNTMNLYQQCSFVKSITNCHWSEMIWMFCSISLSFVWFD